MNSLEQQQINAHIADKGVIKCPTVCSSPTRGIKLSVRDKQQLNRHQAIQNRINYLKKLLFKQGPYYH